MNLIRINQVKLAQLLYIAGQQGGGGGGGGGGGVSSQPLEHLHHDIMFLIIFKNSILLKCILEQYCQKVWKIGNFHSL